MSDISNKIISESYNYILQSDVSTGVIYRIGGEAPINPIFISGLTITDGLTADTISATTYQNLPATPFLPLSGGTISGATNFTNGLTADTISATTYQNLPATPFLPLSGGTISGATNFTNGLTSNTISATTVNITDSLTINNVNITSIIVAMSIALS
jgi:hypothetical protein